MTDERIAEIVAGLLAYAKALPSGSTTTIARLIEETFGHSVLQEAEGDLFEIYGEFIDCVDEEGLRLDNHESANNFVGLPYNIPFTILKRADKEFLQTVNLAQSMISFCFEIGGYFQGEKSLAFYHDNGWHKQAIETDLLEREESVLTACEADIDKVSSAVDACGAFAWEPEYYEPVLDGTQWKLEMYFKEGLFFASEGSNAYPPSFDQFEQLIMQLWD